jgi:hypothetical protein
LRHVFERIVGRCVDTGLIKGEGFAVDAGVIEADAGRYHAVAPHEIDLRKIENPSRPIREYLAALDEAAELEPGRKPPEVVSPSDPSSAWTAKANKRLQFGYGLDCLIDNEHAIIVDVEATSGRTYDRAAATTVMIERTERDLGLKPDQLAADGAYGTGKVLARLIDRGIEPHVSVRDLSTRKDGTFSRANFRPKCGLIRSARPVMFRCSFG